MAQELRSREDEGCSSPCGGSGDPLPHHSVGTWGRIALSDGNDSVTVASGRAQPLPAQQMAAGKGEGLGVVYSHAIRFRPHLPH